MGGKTIRTSGTKAEALQLQSSSRGVTIPWVRGVTRIAGNLVWYNGFRAIPHTETQGGKGGTGKTKNTTYTYVASVILGLCHGPITDVIRVWKGKQIFTGGVTPGQVQTSTESYTPPGSGAMAYTVSHAAAFLSMVSATYPGSGEDGGPLLLSKDVDYTITPAGVFTVLNDFFRGIALSITYQWTSSAITRTALQALGLSFLAGNIGQAAWSGLSGFPTESLGYSGLAAVAGQDYDLGNDASVENHMFEVVAPMAYHLGSSVPDVDPSLFVRELLLDEKAGAGLPPGFLGDWKRWGDYCMAANLLISPALTEQTTAADVIKRAADITCSAISTSGGRIQVIPRADASESGNGHTYTPNLTPIYDLNDECYTPDGSGSPVKYKLKSSAERYNTWSLQYRNRANNYAPDTTDAKDSADIADRGVRANPSAVDADWINNSAVAAKAVQLMMQRSVSVLGEYEVPLPPHFSLIDLVDPLTLTDTRLGMDQVPVLVIGIDEKPNGDLVVICEDYPIGVASAPVYATPDGIGYMPDYNAAPGDVDSPVIFEGPASHAGVTGVEVYVAVRGSGSNWGGARIYTSLDGSNYKLLQEVWGPARYGTLNGAVTSGATSVAVHGLGSAQLNAGSAADAAALVTLCYMGNADGTGEEFFAHQGATLTGAGAYTLSGLVRGAYGTPAAAHTTGGGFVRIDERVAHSGQLDIGMIGSTLHIKCCSFNVYGGGVQSLADVTDFTYVITGRPAGFVPGAGGKGVTIIASSMVFQYPKAGGVSPSSITLTAVRKGVLQGTVTWSVVSGTATLTGSGDTRTLTAANLTTDTATIRATITDAVGTYIDDVTICKVREGADAYSSQLDNGNITFPSDSAGVVSDYSAGHCRMTVAYGNPPTDDSMAWSYSIAATTGITASLGSGASKNLCTVTAMTSAVDAGTITFTATKSGFPNQVLVMTLSKSKSAPGTTGLIDGLRVNSSDVEVGNSSNATATVTLETDGGVTYLANDVAKTDLSWYFPNAGGIGSGYWVYASVSGPDAGDVTGTFNAWLQLNSNRSWTLEILGTVPPVVTKSATVYLVFATDAAGATVVGTAAFNLFANRDT